MSAAPLHPAHPPPLSAAEALSCLLWQPYDCRASPPPPPAHPDPRRRQRQQLPRSRTDACLAGGPGGGAGGGCASAAPDPQSPVGGRHARTRLELERPTSLYEIEEMRLVVPGPGPAAPHAQHARKCHVQAVRVCAPHTPHTSSVHIAVPAPAPAPAPAPEGREDPAVSASVATVASVASASEQQRTFASAECQTEEPARRRRARRGAEAHAPPPPPYSTLPPPPPHQTLAPHPAVVAAPTPQVHRFPFQPIPLRRSGRSAAYACSETGGSAPKSCCGLGGARPPLRWCVLLVGVAGVCCVAAGAVMGALRPHPRAQLTLLLLMIGVGVVLVSVAGLAWRLSARDAPPCRALLGLRRGASCGRRLVPRLPPSYARPHHPYAAMLYPEFHYRPPPPSYQASMQEYRLRLLLLDRSVPALSPPPMYRSNTASLVRGSALGVGWCGSEYSGPPSYRGAPRAPTTPCPSEPPTSLAGVVIDNIGIESFDLKYADDNHIVLPSNNTKRDDEKEEKDNSNLVTIVQTGDNSVQPVIVTVSGSAALAENEHIHTTTEIDILAHL